MLQHVEAREMSRQGRKPDDKPTSDAELLGGLPLPVKVLTSGHGSASALLEILRRQQQSRETKPTDEPPSRK
jgi:hypothetical protein